MVSSYAWSYVKLEILKRTVLASLWSALWPVYLLKMATSVDNPFSIARNRSEKAGQVLADALINKAQGERSVTLMGYSLGARVIYSCLRSLAERKAFGLIEDVVLIGSPIPSTKRNWQVMKSVVSGRITNVYSENDYILAFLYRATSIQLGVAGLQNTEDIHGVHNIDLSSQVSGHLRYPELIGPILRRCGLHDVTVGEEEIENDLPDKSSISIDPGQSSSISARGGKEEHSQDLIDFGDDKEATDAIPISVMDFKSSGDDSGLQGLMFDSPIGTAIQTRGGSETQAPIEGIANLHVNDNHIEEVVRQPPQPVTQHVPSTTTSVADIRRNERGYDSESDDGGIQMVDNDSCDDLQIMSPDPKPYEEDELYTNAAASSSGQHSLI